MFYWRIDSESWFILISSTFAYSVSSIIDDFLIILDYYGTEKLSFVVDIVSSNAYFDTSVICNLEL